MSKLGKIGTPGKEAWVWKADPFNNLAVDDREALLEVMEIGETEAIGKVHELKTKKSAN